MANAEVLRAADALPLQTVALARPRRQVRRLGLQGSEFTWAVAFVIPYLAVFLAFVAYPVVYGLWLGSNPELYAELMSEPIYQRTVVNTTLYLVIGVNLKMFGALLLSGFFMRRGWWVKGLLIIYVPRWTAPPASSASPTLPSRCLPISISFAPCSRRCSPLVTSIRSISSRAAGPPCRPMCWRRSESATPSRSLGRSSAWPW